MWNAALVAGLLLAPSEPVLLRCAVEESAAFAEPARSDTLRNVAHLLEKEHPELAKSALARATPTPLGTPLAQREKEANALPVPASRARAFADVAKKHRDGKEKLRVLALAETAAREETDSWLRVTAHAIVAQELAEVGELTRARALASEAEKSILKVHENVRISAFGDVAAAWLMIRDEASLKRQVDGAVATARSARDSADGWRDLARFAERLAWAERFDLVWPIAEALPENEKEFLYPQLTASAIRDGLPEDAVRAARKIGDARKRALELVDAAGACHDAKSPCEREAVDEALRIVRKNRRIDDYPRLKVSEALAQAGRFDESEKILATVTDSARRREQIGRNAWIAGLDGDAENAKRLAREFLKSAAPGDRDISNAMVALYDAGETAEADALPLPVGVATTLREEWAVRGLVRAGRADEAVARWKKMAATSERATVPLFVEKNGAAAVKDAFAKACQERTMTTIPSSVHQRPPTK